MEDRLLKMHLLEAETASDDHSRAAALRRAGEILIQDDKNIEEGIKHLRSALEAAPENTLTMATLERALVHKGAWAELLEVYDSQLQFISEPMQRCAMLVQAGAIAADHLNDRQRAIGAFSEAATMAVHLPPEPLTRLAQLLEEEGDLDGLVVVLERFIDLATEPTQLTTLLQRLASIHERRDDVEAAVAAYRKALEASPPTHPVYLSAGRAFLRAGRFKELAALFQRAAESEGPDSRAMWLHKAAEVTATKLEGPDEAVELLAEEAEEEARHGKRLGSDRLQPHLHRGGCDGPGRRAPAVGEAHARRASSVAEARPC
jgi:tetratricopeptide (TPR) repeat protein